MSGFYIDGQAQLTMFNSTLRFDLVAQDLVRKNDASDARPASRSANASNSDRALASRRRRSLSIRRSTSMPSPTPSGRWSRSIAATA
jgi:hypothetical protein